MTEFFSKRQGVSTNTDTRAVPHPRSRWTVEDSQDAESQRFGLAGKDSKYAEG
jgi:hypothetical protein